MNLLSSIHRELLARRIGKVLGTVRAKSASAADTPNQRHATFAVLRAARLVSVGNWLAHKAQGRLALLEAQLAKDIMAHKSGFGEAALPSVFAGFEHEVGHTFDWLKGELTDDAQELSDILSEHTLAAGAEHFNIKVATGKNPSDRTSAKLVLGAPLPEHLDKIKSDLLFRLRAETRKAVEAGCTAAETVRRLGLNTNSEKISSKLVVQAGDVAGHEFHGNQYTAEQLSAQEDLKEYRSQFSKLMNSTVKESGQDAENKLGDIAEKHGLPRHIALADHFENILRDKAGLERPAVMQMGNRDYRREETGTWTRTGGRAGAKVNPETSTKLESLFQANRPVHATIHAALDPLSAISIGIRLFDTTDNSIMKFVQALVTELASDADDAAADALDTDDGRRMGTVWVGVADGVQCDRCAFFDGSRWDENGDPVDGGPELEDEPPLHINCRCSILPCDLDAEAPAGNFESYLSRFSNEEQTQAFGSEALKEYRAGRLSPAGLMGQQDNEITLESFRKMEPRLEIDLDKYRRMGAAEVGRGILEQRAATTAEQLGIAK